MDTKLKKIVGMNQLNECLCSPTNLLDKLYQKRTLPQHVHHLQSLALHLLWYPLVHLAMITILAFPFDPMEHIQLAPYFFRRPQVPPV